MRHDRQTTARGLVASLVASALFGVVYFIPAQLTGLSEWETVSWRILITAPLMAALLVGIRSWGAVPDALRLLRRRPALTLVLLLNAALLGLQLWLFAWAPMSGHGLDVALGYLLMPLVMVLAGVLLHRERLGRVRMVAVAAAVFGVAAAFLASAGMSWATFAVAVGYPIYFTIRRALGVDTPGAMWLELIVLTPFAAWFAMGPGSLFAREGAGALPWGLLVLFGAISALALTLYIVASRFLSFSLFGLLSYVEPIVLVLVSLVLLGEGIESNEYLTYGGIGLAVVLLVVEGAVSLRRGPRRDSASSS